VTTTTTITCLPAFIQNNLSKLVLEKHSFTPSLIQIIKLQPMHQRNTYFTHFIRNVKARCTP